MDLTERDTTRTFWEIDRKYIAGTDANSSDVLQNIEAWLDDHQLDPGPFLQRDDMESSRSSGDLLGRLLEALDTEELRRLSIPLDIARKLRRTRL